MPGPWTDATDRKLLLTIIHLKGAGNPPNWDEVAALMGSGFTKESTRQHFQKLRKESEAEFGKLASASPAPAGKGTPRKAKSANGVTPSKSGGKRKANGCLEEDDDEDAGTSPTKKQHGKTEGRKIKEEDAGDDDDI